MAFARRSTLGGTNGSAKRGRNGAATGQSRSSPPPVTGVARVDARTKRLVTRLQRGEIAVVDHADLDRVVAEALIAGGARALVNAANSTTGRYPNMGPLLLARAGVAIVDGVGDDILDNVDEGAVVSLVDGEVHVDGRLVATGEVQTVETLTVALDVAKARLGEELGHFAENTLEYLRRERHMMLDRPPLPDVGIDLRDRHVLVVVRGPSTEADLGMLRPYIREMRPVLIGVDGGADALLRARLTPDVIIGDFDSVTTGALRCGATLVVHAYPGGLAPGAARLEKVGVGYLALEAPGMSEDVAMLLAYEKGAELVVAVGTHVSMEEFLDKGRAGMASTFLTRLMVGSMLVDAKGVARLYNSRVRKRDLFAFVMAVVVLLVVVVLVFPAAHVFADSFWFTLTEKIRHHRR